MYNIIVKHCRICDRERQHIVYYRQTIREHWNDTGPMIVVNELVCMECKASHMDYVRNNHHHWSADAEL